MPEASQLFVASHPIRLVSLKIDFFAPKTFQFLHTWKMWIFSRHIFAFLVTLLCLDRKCCKNGNFIISLCVSFLALRDSFCSARAVEVPAKKFIEEEEGVSRMFSRADNVFSRFCSLEMMVKIEIQRLSFSFIFTVANCHQ